MAEAEEEAGARPFALQRLGVVMAPDPTRPEEKGGVLNPAAVRAPDGALYLFPRVAATDDYARVGVARVRFDERGDPAGVERLGYALEPREEYEFRERPARGGCEDPRVTYLEPLGLYVLAYAAVGLPLTRVALAVSRDLRAWRRLGLVTFEPALDPSHAGYGFDFNGHDNKDAAFFPQAVAGPDGRPALALLHRPMYTYDKGRPPRGVGDRRPGIWLSYCALDDVLRDVAALTRPRDHHELIAPRRPWEDRWIGGGTPPVLTRFGWLMVYHGVSERARKAAHEVKPYRYSAGALVVDRDDPRRVLYRSPEPILTPTAGPEVREMGPDAVFPTGIDDRGDGRIDIYYGMADSSIGAATMRLPDELPGLERG